MKKITGLFLIAVVMISGCGRQGLQKETQSENDLSNAARTVQTIALSAPLDEADAELSGLAWFGDWLVFLPQYPDQYAADGYDGFLYYAERQDVESYLDQKSDGSLKITSLPIEAEGLRSAFKGYEGFEALAFSEDTAYLTIECKQAAKMQGYLVKGIVQGGQSPVLVLDLETIVELDPQARITNMTDEALVIYENNVYSFYEANGFSVNETPVSHRFDLNLNYLGDSELDNIPFRLTDVTESDDTGHFWGMNYYYPGDTTLAGDFKEDPMAANKDGYDSQAPAIVERIIALEITPDGKIQAKPEETIYLQYLEGAVARNWEGLVWFEDYGFLMVTDKFPETILGFVEYP